MTATVSHTDIDRYVDEVATHLGALPEGERAELLDDLREHLAEVAAEGDEPLAARLGSPADYAAELLASAGLVAGTARSGPSRVEQLVAAAQAVRRSRAWQRTADFLPELRPGWWVLRGLLATFALAVAAASQRDRVWPLPRAIGLDMVALIAVAAVVVSVLAGQATARGRAVRVAVVVNVLVVAAFLQAINVTQVERIYQDAGGPPPGMYSVDGQPITNLFPYSADGQLLHGVLLYDQEGRPVDVTEQAGRQGIQSETTADASGAPIVNAFPLEQHHYGYAQPEPAAPGEPPAVVVPRQVTTTSTTTTTAAPFSGAG